MNGPTLLASFLEDHQITQPRAARALKVSPQAVGLWLQRGLHHRVPEGPMRRAIARWTTIREPDGSLRVCVPESAWETDSERELVGRVVPFYLAMESERAAA